MFSRYAGLTNYQKLFEREGVPGPAALAVVGDEADVVTGLRRLVDAGATEIWAVPFDAGAGAESTRRLLESLIG